MPILKSDLKAPVIPEHRVYPVPELGGDVIVRPLLLSDRLALAQTAAGHGAPKDFSHIAALLACSVVDANYERLFTVDQWEAWGATNMRAALDLWDVAWEVSGLDSKKKSDAGSPARDDASVEAGQDAAGVVAEHDLG